MPNANPPDPICKAILICQKTIVEQGTGIVSLIGLFDGFVVPPNGPTGVAELFCCITEAEGRYQITLEIQELASGQAVAGADGPEINITDPLQVNNVIIPIPPLVLRPGQYDIVIFANQGEIDRQKITVKSAP